MCGGGSRATVTGQLSVSEARCHREYAQRLLHALHLLVDRHALGLLTPANHENAQR